MMTDGELLAKYDREGSETAFDELLRRHVDLVYSAALRQVGGDSHGAQDVAQIVFTDLARKAPSLAGHSSIAGWLYTSTRFAAAGIRRSEQRRKAREEKAMEELLPSDEPPQDWTILEQVLDEAMHALSEPDRVAVLLRYFKKESLREVGAVLGISENAARMRIERALEKLRLLLVSRGVTSSTESLTRAIALCAVHAAPVGMAIALASTSIAAATSSPGVTFSLVQFMISTKAKTTILACVAAGIATSFIVSDWKADSGGEATALNSSALSGNPAFVGQSDSTSTMADSVPQQDSDEVHRLRRQVGAYLNVVHDRNAQLERMREREALQEQMGYPVPSEPGTPFRAKFYYPVDIWADVGLETPEAAVQTALWAMNSGTIDIDRLAEAAGLSAEEKAGMLSTLTPEAYKRMPTFGALGILVKDVQTRNDPAGSEVLTFYCELHRDNGMPFQIHLGTELVEGKWRMKHISMVGHTTDDDADATP